MKHARIAVHFQGIKELQRRVQSWKKKAITFYRNVIASFEHFLSYIQMIWIIFNTGYLLLDSIFENNVIKYFGFPRNKLFVKTKVWLKLEKGLLKGEALRDISNTENVNWVRIPLKGFNSLIRD